ncbi:two-component system, response regulator YesN [Ruminococcaceae bacterium YRB3002]|nr:two-component system, response regulator YesN [Ruminococcaceae bacterium YRB3002]
MELIKVFICEDESIVREGLRDMIPWEKYGYEFVGDAPDGEMALPMIRELKPDVLITDITMPFMDGLALSKTVLDELPNIKIIVISGYSDFEYARKAIELGVEQYLLKPVTKADMINALEGTRKKITEENEQKDYVRQYEQEFKKFERMTHRAFFEKLVEGSMSVQEIYEQANKLHLNLSANGYNIVIFTIQDVNQSTYTDDAANVTERLLNQFLQYPDYILFRCNLLSYAVLIKGDADRLPQLEEKCVRMIREQCEQASSALDWHVAVGVPTNRLSGLSSCYADANRAFAYRHLFPRKHVFTSAQLKKEQDAQNDVEINKIDAGKFDPLIIRYFVQTGTLNEVETFTDEYIASLDGSEHSILFRYYLLVSIRVNVELALKEANVSPEDIAARLPAFDMNDTAEEVSSYLRDVLTAAIKMRDAEAQKRSNDIIDNALQYINNHYADEDISLDSVAEAINISANYLSALFSHRVGLSFVEYLTKKRMSRAKFLLRNTSKKSGEIACEIGYKDPRYFSFVFKKNQGCTPSQYRNGEIQEE